MRAPYPAPWWIGLAVATTGTPRLTSARSSVYTGELSGRLAHEKRVPQDDARRLLALELRGDLDQAEKPSSENSSVQWPRRPDARAVHATERLARACGCPARAPNEGRVGLARAVEDAEREDLVRPAAHDRPRDGRRECPESARRVCGKT